MEKEMRLIDANALEKLFRDKVTHLAYNSGNFCILVDHVLHTVRNAPTVDAVEVVHGRWIQSEPGYRLCSHCTADVAIFSGHTNYCPNCGAKMDGDGNG